MYLVEMFFYSNFPIRLVLALLTVETYSIMFGIFMLLQMRLLFRLKLTLVTFINNAKMHGMFVKSQMTPAIGCECTLITVEKFIFMR